MRLLTGLRGARTSRRGPLVMTLLVRDEQDVLEANLEHHLHQGVDHVIVTDNGSIDDTVAILTSYARRGFVTLLEEPADDYAQGEWVTRMARLAAQKGAAWVINNDADEFWWAGSSDIKATLAALPREVGAVRVQRRDFPPVPEGPLPFYERMTLREHESVNALGEPLPPKVCHRAAADVIVAQGNHSVTGTGLDEVIDIDVDTLEILHFPLRSYTQFENKIGKGGAAYRRNPHLPPTTGATWRWLHDLLEGGELRAHYDAQVIDDEAAATGTADGTLALDTRLRDELRQLLSR